MYSKFHLDDLKTVVGVRDLTVTSPTDQQPTQPNDHMMTPVYVYPKPLMSLVGGIIMSKTTS